MIQDELLTRAVAGIPQRSEKQNDIQKLVGSFVDVGILPQIDNVNSQIIYGRRGTGKTHILKVLESGLRKRPDTANVYIDARTLGSTAQFSDPRIDLPSRCTALFRDILAEVYNGLLEFVVDAPPDAAERALQELDLLGRSSTEVHTTVQPETVQVEESKSGLQDTRLQAELTAHRQGITASLGSGESASSETQTKYSITQVDKIIFPSISSPIKAINDACKSKLYLIIDEWSSLPTEVQPFLV